MAFARFLQLSDLHLGRTFGWLAPERREERRRDQRRALEVAVREAIERGVHAILIPGDLFDAEGVDADTLIFALHAFEVVGCPPVFVAPGNHDPYSSTSHYWSPRLLKARGWGWPENVQVFETPEWSVKPLASLPGTRIWGRCFTANGVSSERPLSKTALAGVGALGSAGLDLALFHGSAEGRCPPGQVVTAPFSETEVQRSPFTYHAVGHYHVASRLEHGAGDGQASSAGVRLAYAGSAVALDSTELGRHGALEVRIDYGHRQPFVEVEPVELDRRRVYQLEAEVSGASSAEQVDRRVQKALDAGGVTEQDIVTVRLTGRLHHGVRYTGPAPQLRTRVFNLRVDRRGVRPDYDLEAYKSGEARTTEERFVRAIITQRDAEKDPAQRSVIESALYYGLDAFRLREVAPVYEELGE